MLVDTNALSAWADGEDSIVPHLSAPDMLFIPSVVLGEFYSGMQRSRHHQEYQSWLKKTLPAVKVANISHKTSQYYAKIRNDLKRMGKPIPANDVWIAALAVQLCCPLLSNDRHFDSVPNLLRVSF